MEAALLVSCLLCNKLHEPLRPLEFNPVCGACARSQRQNPRRFFRGPPLPRPDRSDPPLAQPISRHRHPFPTLVLAAE